MYETARHHTKLTTRRPWWWYLERALNTTLKFGAPGVGVMDGTVFRQVLRAARAEGAAGNATLAVMADKVEANMRSRQKHWAAIPYPYGSEFGFDTTGQEEGVVWSLYFEDEPTAKKTVDHILSYMRSSPTWAYHGGARSWGDVGNNGKWMVTFGTGANDRGQMHYRSGLNMIPLAEWCAADPIYPRDRPRLLRRHAPPLTPASIPTGTGIAATPTSSSSSRSPWAPSAGRWPTSTRAAPPR